MNVTGWFADSAHWTGPDGVPAQVGHHLVYTLLALGISLAIAVPLGMFIGYTGRGGGLVVGSANALRALPTLGALVLLFLLISSSVSGQAVYLIPTTAVLVLLGVPPILAGTYAGIQNADSGAVGAARAMGYTRAQILVRVQLPCALPLMLSGIRSATLQIVSTATVAAYVGLQGLGRFILDGRAEADFTKMTAGALLVAVLAIAFEVLFALVGRFTISPGLRRAETSATRSRPSPAIPVPAPGT
ncbi:glycine/betaine ABC transporter permease [Williamsia phyllosphaerae]|uniref:Glycine/betaine ABC transporter permease n=1 Tax=Williamsia phyllosphaerae TaxID=885042 RepID=A0ABQ1V2G4_9NOCA|nr:ABC transporter permease [Williamsia phyllosphaerae]GGF33489.1 glycine/betaine ABC transporter permease [Williamsia phyllosphaerae]